MRLAGFGVDAPVEIVGRELVAKENDRPQILEHTVVHVGSGHGNVAEGGMLERAALRVAVHRWLATEPRVR